MVFNIKNVLYYDLAYVNFSMKMILLNLQNYFFRHSKDFD